MQNLHIGRPSATLCRFCTVCGPYLHNNLGLPTLCRFASTRPEPQVFAR